MVALRGRLSSDASLMHKSCMAKQQGMLEEAIEASRRLSSIFECWRLWSVATASWFNDSTTLCWVTETTGEYHAPFRSAQVAEANVKQMHMCQRIQRAPAA
jgi:hypothetical protein